MTVAVIGGGAIGLVTAIELAARGASVVLVDREATGRGASMGNAGVIAPASAVPMALPGIWRQVPGWLLKAQGPVKIRAERLPRLLPWGMRFLAAATEARARASSHAMAALIDGAPEAYRALLADAGADGLIRDAAYVYASRDRVSAGLGADLGTELKRALGATVDVLDADALRAEEPALSTEFGSAIAVRGQARTTSPGAVCDALLAKALGLGVQVREAEVMGMWRDDAGAWRMQTTRGPMRADTVILAAGAWSARLLAPLGVDVPLEAERGHHVVFEGAEIPLRNVVMDTGMKIVANPMEGGLRVAGTSEFATLDSRPDPDRAEAVEDAARRMAPGLDGEARHWTGVRPSLPDSLPALGPVPGLPGLIAAFGHSHWGFMSAPATGRIAAALALGETPNVDLAPYAPGRFG